MTELRPAEEFVDGVTFRQEHPGDPGFVVKDSGVRQEYSSGMVRDTQEGKPRFGLLIPQIQPYDTTMLYRWAAHMTKGAGKYGLRNWEEAGSDPTCAQEELERFQESGMRHHIQHMAGMQDEDHAAAVMFNLNAEAYVRWRIQNRGD